MYRFEVQMQLSDGREVVLMAVPVLNAAPKIKLRVVKTHIPTAPSFEQEPSETAEQDFYDPDDTWYELP